MVKNVGYLVSAVVVHLFWYSALYSRESDTLDTHALTARKNPLSKQRVMGVFGVGIEGATENLDTH